MSINVTIPPELEQFVRDELSSGQFPNEDSLLVKALELYREMRGRHDRLRADVEGAREQARNGHVSELDIEHIVARGIERAAESGIDN